jgi:type IV secretory pathway TraG/TraD family ATPase VirD4
MWAFVQDLNQLKWHYPNEWETFVANASALVCFGMMDIFTLEYIEKTLGKTTIRYETKNMSKTENMRIRDDRPMGPGPSIFEGFFRDNNAPAEELAGHSISENTTQHVQAQPLASIDELRKMHRQKCIVISHDDPVMCWRVDYYSDKTFSAWARPDPKYAKR